jgi:hypothetical protein
LHKGQGKADEVGNRYRKEDEIPSHLAADGRCEIRETTDTKMRIE